MAGDLDDHRAVVGLRVHFDVCAGPTVMPLADGLLVHRLTVDPELDLRPAIERAVRALAQSSPDAQHSRSSPEGTDPSRGVAVRTLLREGRRAASSGHVWASSHRAPVGRRHRAALEDP